MRIPKFLRTLSKYVRADTISERYQNGEIRSRASGEGQRRSEGDTSCQCTTVPSVLQKLPDDVLRLIFDRLVKINPNARLSRKRTGAEATLRLNILRKIVVVCKAWYIIAVPLLYAQCVVANTISLELLWRTMKSSRKEVKSFTYAQLRPDKDIEPNPYLLFQICRSFPEDVPIDIVVFIVTSSPFKRRTFSDIARSLTCLRVKECRQYGIDKGPVFPPSMQLPNLACLVMESFLFEDQFDWPSVPALEELAFDGCLFNGRDDVELLSTFKAIKRLELRQSSSGYRLYPISEIDALSGLFMACASTLEHLSVVVRTGDRPYPVWNNVDLLTRLRSFSYGFEMYESVYNSLDPLEIVDEIFCVEFIPEIPRISFAPTLSRSLVNHTLEYFLDRYVPSMGVKAIRFFGFKNLFGETDMLKQRCEELGIELDNSGCVFESGHFIVFPIDTMVTMSL